MNSSVRANDNFGRVLGKTGPGGAHFEGSRRGVTHPNGSSITPNDAARTAAARSLEKR